MSQTLRGLNRERRAAPRTAFETTATVHMVNQEFKCQTRNLSPEGLALAGHEAMVPAGTFMRVQFKLPKEKQPIDVDGILVRSDPRNTSMIWGLRFIEPPDGAQSKIESYLDTRVPEPPRLTRAPVVSAEPISSRNEEAGVVGGDEPAAAEVVVSEPEEDARHAAFEAAVEEPPKAECQLPLIEHEKLPDEVADTEPEEAREIDVPLVPKSTPAPAAIPLSLSPSHQTSGRDSQFIYTYEEALAKASHQRLLDQAAAQRPPEVEAATSPRSSTESDEHGGTTSLDRELQWLYDEATRAEAGDSTARRGRKARRRPSRKGRARAS
ncbi:MAG: PilZ domain-containing protein [Acidobacteriota bacterium]|nr:PilZ domain-containing protein [Acidobacteriota bacterium]